MTQYLKDPFEQRHLITDAFRFGQGRLRLTAFKYPNDVNSPNYVNISYNSHDRCPSRPMTLYQEEVDFLTNNYHTQDPVHYYSCRPPGLTPLTLWLIPGTNMMKIRLSFDFRRQRNLHFAGQWQQDFNISKENLDDLVSKISNLLLWD